LNLKSNPVSVLIIEADPSILVFTARVLEGNGIRALLARSADDAVALAQMQYVPIDVVLANAAVLAANDSSLLGRLRELRPHIRHVGIAAFVDDEIIRMQPLTRAMEPSHQGLVDLIRQTAAAPAVRSAAS